MRQDRNWREPHSPWADKGSQRYLWNERSLALAIDYDLWLRIAQRYPFDYVDEPLVKYRTGHASLSRRTEERLKTAARIMTRFLEPSEG